MKVGILGFSVDPSSSPTFGVLWLGHVDMEEVVMYTEKVACQQFKKNLRT